MLWALSSEIGHLIFSVMAWVLLKMFHWSFSNQIHARKLIESP